MISSSSTSSALQIYNQQDQIVSSSNCVDLASSDHLQDQTSHTSSLLYNLSVLKDKVHQVQSLVSILVSPDGTHLHHHHQHKMAAESTSMAVATMGTLVQEIIVAASSMMFSCQQMALISSASSTSAAANNHDHQLVHHQISNKGPDHDRDHHESGLPSDHFHLGNNSNKRVQAAAGYSSNDIHQADHYSWYSTDHQNSGNNPCLADEIKRYSNFPTVREDENKFDIIELAAADLLAKYTHYCQVCGKGFKRDANLRMHMRAHGEEYKSSAALTNPRKHNKEYDHGNAAVNKKLPRKYSCPQQGCRWNQKHVKFQPLKSIVCVKNHYKRSHCPKMYICKRCNRKQFSVLSDLRTHEKHCGDLKWQCSCGTTFSRKDKLMGHVALFLGHTPVNPVAKTGKVEEKDTQTELLHNM